MVHLTAKYENLFKRKPTSIKPAQYLLFGHVDFKAASDAFEIGYLSARAF